LRKAPEAVTSLGDIAKVRQQGDAVIYKEKPRTIRLLGKRGCLLPRREDGRLLLHKGGVKSGRADCVKKEGPEKALLPIAPQREEIDAYLGGGRGGGVKSQGGA